MKVFLVNSYIKRIVFAETKEEARDKIKNVYNDNVDLQDIEDFDVMTIPYFVYNETYFYKSKI